MQDPISHVYVLVRQDLSFAQQSVQAAHTLLEASRQGLIPSDTPHPALVLLATENLWQLKLDCEWLRSHEVRFALFLEPDQGGQPTALATEPITQERRKIFRRFPLLRGGLTRG